MSAARLLSGLAGGAARRPRVVIAVAVLLGLGGAALALRLRPSAQASTFVSSSSAEYEATQRFYRSFGEEPIDVLVKGSLEDLVLSSDIDRLVGLEGCLSGNVPRPALVQEGGPNGPCGQLARARAVKVVLGPATFINEAAAQIDESLLVQTKQAEAEAKQAEHAVAAAALARGLSAAEAGALGRQASSATMASFHASLAAIALQYGLTSEPSLEDPNFVQTLIFDPSKPAGTPKQRFAYLFPSPAAALISVRMRAGLSEAERTRTIGLIRKAVAMPQWRLEHGEVYLVTGEPVIVSDLNHSITHSIELLLLAVLIVMALALGLAFSGRPRLLPLAVALIAAAVTFGALSLVGASLTMASIAVLPVLVGLAVDYAIQFQSRIEETVAEDGDRASGAPTGDGTARRETPRRAELIESAARAGAPTIATAGLASAAAMLVLVLSPVPMVRGFGVLLVVGVAVAFVCALSAGAAALALVRPLRSAPAAPPPVPLAGVQAAWRGARELVLENPLRHWLSRAALERGVRRPARVLGLGLLLAALGWGLDTQTKVDTDITKLVPQNLSSLENLNTLERVSGVGGEIDLMISGKDLATPATIEWMSSYESTVLKRAGYSASRGCGKARLCPAFSLPDLFSTAAAPSSTGSTASTGATGSTAPGHLTQTQVSGLLAAVPPYFTQDVISADRRVATLAFGIRLMGLTEQERLIELMRSALHPPRGISAQLVGLPVLAAASGSEVASPWRRVETLIAGLLAVGLVLLLAFRGDVRRALVPLVPILLATGWSALILFLTRVPLNPMSVTLGALVIALSTEFSVLLSERYRQERLAGRDTLEALRRTYARTGAAVAASGLTAIAGFGVLVLSDIRMLRDFGLVTLIDLSVSLIGVLLALPAALVLSEGAALAGAQRRGSRGALGAARIAPGHDPA